MTEDIDYLDTLPKEEDVGINKSIHEAVEQAANEISEIEEKLYELDKQVRQLKVRKEYILNNGWRKVH